MACWDKPHIVDNTRSPCRDDYSIVVIDIWIVDSVRFQPESHENNSTATDDDPAIDGRDRFHGLATQCERHTTQWIKRTQH